MELALRREAEAEAGVEGRGGVAEEEEVEVGAGSACMQRVAIFGSKLSDVGWRQILVKVTGQVLKDLPGGEELPGLKGTVADAMEQASTRSLSDSCAGVEVWRFLIEEPSQELLNFRALSMIC